MKWVNGFILCFLAFTVICCNPKQNQLLNNHNELNETIEINELDSNNKQILFVKPFEGLNLREEPDLTGKIIRLLLQYTELSILEKNLYREKIDELENYWYRVNTGTDVGWVFGAYLSTHIYPEKPDLTIGESVILKFNDTQSIIIQKNFPASRECYYMDLDSIKVYERTDKKTGFQEITNKKAMLFQLPGEEDWLYLITEDFNSHGYIYVYDISKTSFYGNQKENEKSGNYYKKQLYREHEILMNNNNYNRYGPLLEIKYNNTVNKIWDSFAGSMPGTLKYLLLEDIHEHDEVLVYCQPYEGGINYIYNLRLQKFVCKIGDIRYFNNARNAVFSLEYGYGDPGITLEVFFIKNGIYEKIINENIPLGYNFSINGYWINDNFFQIDYVNIIFNHDSGKEVKEEKRGSLYARRNNSSFELEHKNE